MSPEYLVINCRFWDGTSDYYDRLITLAEDYIDGTEDPTVTGFNKLILLLKGYVCLPCTHQLEDLQVILTLEVMEC